MSCEVSEATVVLINNTRDLVPTKDSDLQVRLVVGWKCIEIDCRIAETYNHATLSCYNTSTMYRGLNYCPDTIYRRSSVSW